MDSETLRTIQAPLKEHYRSEPEAALVVLSASATLGEGVTCSIESARGLVRAGLHPASGGDGLSACSGDMLLQALVACAGVTMQAVATSLGIDVAGTVHAEGDLDFRGTLAVERDVPVGFRAIRLRFDLDSEAEDDQLDKLLELTERYCVVLQTLARTPAITVGRR